MNLQYLQNCHNWSLMNCTRYSPIDGSLPLYGFIFMVLMFIIYYVNFVGNINIDDKLIDNLKCASNIYCFFGDMEILSWISHIIHESLHHYLLQSDCLASLILEINLRKFRCLIFLRFYYLFVLHIFSLPLPTQYLVISASPSVPAPCRRWPACWPGQAGGSPYHEGQHRIC